MTLARAVTADFTPAQFQVPDGYTVELVAAPPLVQHPMMGCFDERGRLFIAESAGLNLERKELEKQLPNSIVMLEDTDGDGKFDKSTVFADKMTFPMGAQWHDGALFVASSGGVWKLRDTNGDGVADERKLLVGAFGYIGNAADVHGCFLHPDGRIYFVEGRHGHEVNGVDGKLISKSKAGGIFSIRPDGSDFHRHATGGFDNPVELAFTDEGDVVGTVNLFEYPPRQDCLVHWIEGGLYPRRDFVGQWDEFVSTGDLLPAVFSFGHVAVSGLTRCRTGGPFASNLFVTEFNTHRLIRIELEPLGSTYAAKSHDFLASSSGDFHPTDVLEDADGSLLLIDTGGWFRIGCPTSQIAKPQVAGAIYRIRRNGAPKVEDPRGLKIDWASNPAAIAGLLDDPRFAVADRAVDELARRGAAGLGALQGRLGASSSPSVRRKALWATVRIEGDQAKAMVRLALGDPDAGVRQVAAHGVGLLRDEAAVEKLSSLVAGDSPAIRREAAVSLGLIRRAEAVPTLLHALGEAPDQLLDHSLIHALISINAPQATAAGLTDPSPAVRRGAMVALDRMGSGLLTAPPVIAALDSDDAPLREVALSILVGHKEWAEQVGGILSERLSRPSLGRAELAMVRGLVGAFIGKPAVAEVVAKSLESSTTTSAVRVGLLESLPVERGAVPESAAKAVTSLLGAEDHDVALAAVLAARGVKSAQTDAVLRGVADDAMKPSDVRLAALACLGGGGDALSPAGFELLLSELGPEKSLLARQSAAQTLSQSRLDERQLVALIETVRRAGPIELPLLLRAYERPEAAPVTDKLFAAIGESPGLPAVTPDRLEALVKKLGLAGASAGGELLERVRWQVQSQQARLDELEKSVTGGQPERGRAVFYSKGTCFVCHRIGGEGGLVGPDLSMIGASRTRRDLLESIAFPSASFARGYEPVTAALKSGETYLGRIARETQEVVILVDVAGAEHAIRRESIREMHQSPASLMPPGLDRVLTTQELSDLLAYLESRR